LHPIENQEYFFLSSVGLRKVGKHVLVILKIHFSIAAYRGRIHTADLNYLGIGFFGVFIKRNNLEEKKKS
jgi:hypothetical protein